MSRHRFAEGLSNPRAFTGPTLRGRKLIEHELALSGRGPYLAEVIASRQRLGQPGTRRAREPQPCLRLAGAPLSLQLGRMVVSRNGRHLCHSPAPSNASDVHDEVYGQGDRFTDAAVR